MIKKYILSAIILSCGITGTAWAYVGPGAGLSLLGALWGLILAVGAALGFVVLWPLRRMIKRHREKKMNDAPGSVRGSSAEVPKNAPQG